MGIPYYDPKIFLKVFGGEKMRSQKFHPTFKISFNTQRANNLLINNILKEGLNLRFCPFTDNSTRLTNFESFLLTL